MPTSITMSETATFRCGSSLKKLLSISAVGPKLNGVLIAVKDSGTGLDSESLSRVFDAFYTTPSPMAWAWVWLSAARSSRHTAGGCGQLIMCPTAPSFSHAAGVRKGRHAESRQTGVCGLKSMHRCRAGDSAALTFSEGEFSSLLCDDHRQRPERCASIISGVPRAHPIIRPMRRVLAD
jgi:hypothetical protein